MRTVRKFAEGSQSLAALETAIRQQEGLYGPLVGFDVEAPYNSLVFAVGASPEEAQRAVLARYQGHPPERPGAVLVCAATCLVEGKPVPVAAYRSVPSEG